MTTLTLLIDGASPTRTVALAQGDSVLAAATLGGGRASPWFGAIDGLLHPRSLDRDAIGRLAVCLGPGSYTGIRATLALAQGWHLARGTGVVGLSSVDAGVRTAWRAGWRGRLATVIDAQRGEYYLAEHLLLDSGPQDLTPLRIASREEVDACRRNGARCAGPDAAAASAGGEILVPDAAALAELAHAAVAADLPDAVARLEPRYLRTTSFVKAARPRTIP